MTAIEMAAVERLRNSVGNAQNGDLKESRPARATLMSAIAANGFAVKPVPVNARAATASGIAECKRRSLRRSELRDHMTIAIVAMMYGTIAMTPICVCVS